jgi:NADPH-dependent 2,4-dienoyl-CoA reductase/sulfur reductase-like enzyme/nitrite reductase/ring-hydroxylating ferredoxin subunit
MDHSLAPLADIPDGGMRAFDAGGTCVLLSRDGDKVMAVGAHCTHHGAPLADGVRVGRRVICPWHHAIFDLESGAHVEPPGEGRLMKFAPRVVDGIVMLDLDNERGKEERDEIDDVTAHPKDKLFIIVGAGAAGRAGAEELRRQGYDGRVLLISAEKDMPYDRPELSKSFLASETSLEDLEILSRQKLADKGIEFLDRSVAKIMAADKKVIFEDGGELTYDACLAAPGSAAREPEIDDKNLLGVYTLRSKSDALRLKLAASEAKKIVIVGSGFIGMEVAAVFAEEKKLVTVLTPDPKPFARVFGTEIAEALIEAHRAAGTAIRLETSVNAIDGKDGHVCGVRLNSGEFIPADLVLLATGAAPRIDMIEGATHSADGGIAVDATLKVTADLWAAGDIASFPSHFAAGQNIRIEHWRLAEQLGRHAARAMLGDTTPFAGIPFFWTLQHWTLNLVGLTKSFDEVHIEGDLAGGKFMAYYILGGRVIAGLGGGDADKTAPLHALYLGGGMPLAQELKEAGWDPTKLPLAKALQAA